MNEEQIGEASELLRSIKQTEESIRRIEKRTSSPNHQNFDKVLEVAISSASRSTTGYTETSSREVVYLNKEAGAVLKAALLDILRGEIEGKRKRLTALGMK